MIDLETKGELLEGGGTCVVSVAGELDLSTAPRFKRTLLAALGRRWITHRRREGGRGGRHA
jgi:anti-anti-sigma regulatory factor